MIACYCVSKHLVVCTYNNMGYSTKQYNMGVQDIQQYSMLELGRTPSPT